MPQCGHGLLPGQNSGGLVFGLHITAGPGYRRAHKTTQMSTFGRSILRLEFEVVSDAAVRVAHGDVRTLCIMRGKTRTGGGGAGGDLHPTVHALHHALLSPPVARKVPLAALLQFADGGSQVIAVQFLENAPVW